MATKDLFTVPEAAVHLGVSTATVRRAIADKKLRLVANGPSSLGLVRRVHLEQYRRAYPKRGRGRPVLAKS